MIINVGQRTDIPAFFSEWFYNRIKEGYVQVRNPYYPSQVMQYQLHPRVVDCLSFCTKNPKPMLARLDEISQYRQLWSVTITPYGKEIEPLVPEYHEVIKSFQELSNKVGAQHMFWRYDPIFIDERYTLEYHIQVFEEMASLLSGYTHQCVISFIDLYEKTKRNFPHAKLVSLEEQLEIGRAFSIIGEKYHIQIRTCLEGDVLKRFGIETSGCMTQQVIENAIGEELILKKKTMVREGCSCLLGNDIGAYNTCPHGCLYCYANEDKRKVKQQYALHDVHSPMLIGHLTSDDHLIDAKQETWINPQLSLFSL